MLADGKSIKLNDGTGVITCESICAFTGSPHSGWVNNGICGESLMPLDKSSLKTKIVKEMKSKGMVTEGEFAKAADLASKPLPLLL